MLVCLESVFRHWDMYPLRPCCGNFLPSFKAQNGVITLIQSYKSKLKMFCTNCLLFFMLTSNGKYDSKNWWNLFIPNFLNLKNEAVWSSYIYKTGILACELKYAKWIWPEN